MAKSEILQVKVGSASMTDHADFLSESTSELLHGETVEILSHLEDDDGELWVEAIHQGDQYQGYVPLGALGKEIHKPTHKVYALRSFVYPEPDVKTLPILALSFASQVHVTQEKREGFIYIKDTGWIWEEHLMKISDTLPDYTATAERFIGTPYLWGGRTSFGLDCSALVQLSVMASGRSYPRDTRDQVKTETALDKDSPLQRGDIVFFKGHVGVMVDSRHILNASARSMDTRIEKLSDLVKAYKGITSIQRL